MTNSPPENPLTLTTTVLLHSAATPPPTHPVTPSLSSSIPQSKLIPKTRFIIDGFKHADPNFSTSYFLSHFHSDHYTGLTPQWTSGIIYCSDQTARLLNQILLIPKPYIRSLPLRQPVSIDGIEVSLVDANHCPGAVQFLFKVPDEGGNFCKYVHTGDFRYSVEMKSERLLCDFVGADAVFLDTTYCDPKYKFPSQEESIDYVVSVIDEKLKGGGEKVLFLVATYVIGKERILLEVARRCKRKVCVSRRKMEVLRAAGLGEGGVFTEDEMESDVHVVSWNVLGETWPYFRPNFVKMKEIMGERGYDKVVGFVPTGWAYEIRKNKFSVRMKEEFEIHLVPYSEHSNYDELREYVKFLKPKRVIPTVGVDVEKIDSKHAHAMQKHFAGLVDEMAVKQEFLMGFTRGDSREVHEAVKMDNPLVSDIGQMQEDEDALSAGISCGDTKLGSGMTCSHPQEGLAIHDSEDLRDSDLEKSVEELRDCLPGWVTRSQMLNLLRNADGNVVEAVSDFFEHETEFHEEVLSSTSFTCTPQDGSESNPSLPFESTPVQNVHHSEGVSLTERLKLSSSPSLKTSRNSPGKRKRNPDSKVTKRGRADPTKKPSDSKQYSITKFFSKKAPVTVGDSKVQNESEHSNNDQRMFPANTLEQYKEETEKFIQIVNGSDSLRGYAANIIEKAKGDINTALDLYYSENAVTPNENKYNSLEINKLVESECTSRNEEIPESKEVEIKPDICCAASTQDEIPGNYVSLPPERYSPIEHACWKKGQPAPYIHIARTFDLVEEEKGRLKATSMLCNMFRSLLALSPEDVLPAVYLCTNKIAPDHENTELNIGGSTVVAALEEVCGTTKSRINNLYNTHGDLGDVAQLCRQTQSLLAPPAVLTIQGVYSVLRKISVQTGSGSTIKKKRLIMNLMCSCREKEMKFLVRTLVRNLRIGAMMRSVLPALAQAIVMNSSDEQLTKNLKDRFQSLSSSVVEAYNIVPDLDLLIPSLLEKGIEFSLSTLSIVPGVPMKPMLAKITNGATQVLKLFQDKAFTCEYKYDGQRAQIHRLEDGSVRVFSRNGDETTSRFPDLIEIVKDSCAPTAVTFILDAEVVAIDRKNMNLMSFQELSSRERGSKDSLVAIDKIKVDICIFVFDVMFANGKQLLDLPLRQRRKYFRELFNAEKPGYFEYATEMTVESRDADASNETTLNIMSTFLEEALRSSCEGIMVKCLDVDAGYTPSKRSDAWLKVKRDYVEGLSDSLDLVPIGAWYGNGRKAGWFSPFLMACYNPDTEDYQSVCRVMSGFSDAFYREMKEFFSGDKILAKKPVYYQTAEVADIWFSPEVVWQIKGADFTVSPVHHAAIGLVHSSRGISVRFPRFIRTVTDRKPEECSTSSDIADMFSSQTRKMDVSVKK